MIHTRTAGPMVFPALNTDTFSATSYSTLMNIYRATNLVEKHRSLYYFRAGRDNLSITLANLVGIIWGGLARCHLSSLKLRLCMLASVTVTGLLTFTLNLLLDVYTRVVYEVHEIHPCSTETLDIALLVLYKSAYSCLVLAGHGSLPCEDLVAFPDPPWGLGDRTIRACISAGIQSRALIIIVGEASHSCDMRPSQQVRCRERHEASDYVSTFPARVPNVVK